MTTPHTFRAGFLFSGLGAGALGFMQSRVNLGPDAARFENVGGIDIEPDACEDFERLTGKRATCADVAKMTPSELRAAWGATAPDTVFLSPPCKGFSGLLSASMAKAEKYQALNRLVLQGVWLLCETWPDAPPPTIVLENVPRIVSRGAVLLDQVCDLLHRFGYRTHRDHHDCGEIGGLAQHRRRFLLVARRPEVVPAFIYRPPIQRVRGCGEVLGLLPMPEDPDAGVMHLLPRLSWLTWLRLALIPAGGDWRDLPGVVPDGTQRRAVWSRNHVGHWNDPARTVAGEGSNGGFAVADPRIGIEGWFPNVLGVTRWSAASGTVTGQAAPTRGAFSVADPRVAEMVALGQTARGAGTFKGRPGLMGVAGWGHPSSAVTGSASVTGSNATAAVADPRIGLRCRPRAGAYGVVGWRDAAACITGAAGVDNGAFAVADPRDVADVPPVIRAADDTWHRPMTSLDLAALQDIASDILRTGGRLAGKSHAKWRERIGNAVPKQAATAVGNSILLALLAGRLGTWTLGATGIWVRNDGRTEHEWRADA